MNSVLHRFTRLFTKKNRRPIKKNAKGRAFFPLVEALEDRCVLAQLYLHFDFDPTTPGTPTAGEVESDSFSPPPAIAGQFQVHVDTNPLASTPTPASPAFITLCADLVGVAHPGDVCPVTPEPTSVLLNGGEVAYLYNHYGNSTANLGNPILPMGDTLTNAENAAGLQIAIWELITDPAPNSLATGAYQYGPVADPTSRYYPNTDPSNPDEPNILAAANYYLGQAAGKNESAIYLAPACPAANGDSGQGMLAPLTMPSLVTTATPNGTVALGTTSPTLNDAAVLSGGYSPGGTITFTLSFNNGTTTSNVYTDVVTIGTNSGSVTGNGTYNTSMGATPGGYMLPATGKVTGTYTWSASYSGDALNTLASDPGTSAQEQLTVTPAKPSIVTTPGSTPGSGITIGGTKYLDLTGDGFSSDDTPQSGVTINLYMETNSTAGLQVGGDAFVGSTTTASNGTYSFALSSPGTYYVQESVPSGYIQTGGGPNGSAGNTYFTVVATSGHAYGGNNFDDFFIPTCAPINVCYKVTTPNGYSQTVTNLSGNTQQGDTVTVTFTVPSGMNDTLTLVSYIAPAKL